MKYFTINVPWARHEIFFSQNFNPRFIIQLMRIGFISIALILTTIQLLLAVPVKSQKLSSVEVKIELKNETLLSALKKIEQQTSFRFVYRKGELMAIPNRNIVASTYTVEEVLDLLFSNTNLSYKQVANNVLIKVKSFELVPGRNNIDIQGADIPVKGRVTDSNGQALPGVSVRIIGTSVGTTTNLQGDYSINSPEDGTLIFSYIGFVAQEVSVNGRGSINIQLQEDAKYLDEVVVTALGISREKKSLAYSLTEVNGEEFTRAREVNLGSALTGRIAGVNATSTATGPGGSSRVLIRGNTSLSGDNQPLYVINGIPMSSSNLGQATGSYGGFERGDGLNSINPDDIATISVLKGGAAAALYGSRASAGVILITTKSGGKGGLGVEFNSSYTLQSLSVVPDWQYEYGSGTRGKKPQTQGEAVQYGRTSWGALLDGSSVINPDGVSRTYTAQKDNFENFYEDGQAISNNLAISGGGEAINFRVSASDLNNKSIVPNFVYKRNSFDLNVNANLSDKILFKGNAQYTLENGGNRPGLNDFTDNPNASLYVMTNSLDVRTLAPGYDDRGFEVPWNDLTFAINPYFAVNKRDVSDERKRLIGSFNTRYNVTDYLYVSGQIGVDTYNFNALSLTPTGSLTSIPGSMSESDQTFTETNLSAMVGFNKTIDDRFSVDLFVGGNQMHQQSKSAGFSSGNFNVPFNYFIRNGLNPNFSQNFGEMAINSLYGSANIGFNNYLYLTVTGRQDWFSTLSPKSNSLFYPSAGLSFVFSDALKSLPSWLSSGKVRASWAQVGGGAPNPYALRLGYTAESVSHLGRPMMRIGTSTIPNSMLKPFTSTTQEAGLDLSMFNNKFRADITLYNQNTTNDIVSANVPNVTGYSSVLVNVGKIQNKGIELLLTGRPINSNNGFSWETSYNIAYNKNTVVRISEDMDRLSVGAPPRTLNGFVYHFEGQPYGMIAGYKAKRSADNKIVYDAGTKLPVQSDLVILGKGVPPLTMGLTNNFFFKRFSMNFLIDGKFGGSIYSGTNANATLFGLHKNTIQNNQRKNGVTLTGVDKDGKVFNEIISAQDYYQGIALRITDEFVYDADFVKLRQLSFGYDLPPSLLSKAGIQSANLSLIGRNLLLLYSQVPNIDPESSYHSSGHQGLDSFGIPPTRSFGLSLNLKF